MEHELIEEENQYIILLKQNGIFSNIVNFKSILNTLKTNKNIIIDCGNMNIIDHSFMAFVKNFQKNDSFERNIEFIGKNNLHGLSKHPLATRVKK